MFKRFSSLLIISSLILSQFTVSVSATNVSAELISGVNLTINNISNTEIHPSNNETLSIAVNYNNNDFSGQISNSSGSIKVLKDQKIIKTLATWNTGEQVVTSVSWDAKLIDNNADASSLCGNTGAACPDGDYKIVVSIASVVDSNITLNDEEIKNFTIGSSQNTESPINIDSFTLNKTTIDPSPYGDNDSLVMNFNLNEKADSMNLKIFNEDNEEIKTYTMSNLNNGSYTWDGEINSELALAGNYKATLTVSDNGTTDSQTQTFSIVYSSTNRPKINGFDVNPDSFNPDFDDAEIKFENDNSAYITLEIVDNNDNLIKSFSDYSDDYFSDNESHTLIWDGRKNSGVEANTGTYKVQITAKNNYGILVSQRSVIISNDSQSISSTNAHISGISISPHSFDPSDDDELKIEYDVKTDLDDLKIFIEKGSDKIEIEDDSDIDEDDNYKVYWDGEDDDNDFARKGTWMVIFESQKNGEKLLASKSFTVEYEKPDIDAIYVSKSTFDNKEGEFTYLLFKIDTDAEVDVEILEDNKSEDFLEEKMEVEGDRWYAVEWDGDNFKYDDDLSFKLTAYNLANEDVYDSQKIAVGLDEEDDSSSNRSNITNDYISPVVNDFSELFEIHYDLEDTADIVVSIHRGTSYTGTKVAELANISDQEAGTHVIQWNGKDDNDKFLSNGVYNYKIQSKISSTDTEYGKFIIGDVGDAGDVYSSSSNYSNTSNYNSNPNVVVDGLGTVDTDTPSLSYNTSYTGDIAYDESIANQACGFYDVKPSSKYCTATKWVKDNGIFNGYIDGSFRANQAINRAEILKVILEYADVNVSLDNSAYTGFKDLVSGEWYIRYIVTAKQLGIFHGDEWTNTARPADNVNRVEALKFVFETLRVSHNYNLQSCAYMPFNDVLKDSWYYNYVCESNKYGLFDEITNGYFGADSEATRGEVAMILYRINEGQL